MKAEESVSFKPEWKSEKQNQRVDESRREAGSGGVAATSREDEGSVGEDKTTETRKPTNAVLGMESLGLESGADNQLTEQLDILEMEIEEASNEVTVRTSSPKEGGKEDRAELMGPKKLEPKEKGKEVVMINTGKLVDLAQRKRERALSQTESEETGGKRAKRNPHEIDFQIKFVGDGGASRWGDENDNQDFDESAEAARQSRREQ